MTRLDDWLRRATRHLSSKSAAQVRSEIQEHYELSRETALSEGAAAEEADRLAMAALGDARTANCQYRRVLLTSAEARLLRESIWEVRTVCARPWLKRALLATPVAALLAAILVFVASGGSQMFRMLLGNGNRSRPDVCRAVPAPVYAAARPYLPACEMVGADGRGCLGAWAQSARLVLAADLLLVAGRMDRMDADFDSSKVAGCRLAEESLPLAKWIFASQTRQARAGDINGGKLRRGAGRDWDETWTNGIITS